MATSLGLGRVTHVVPSAKAAVYKDGKKTDETELHFVLKFVEIVKDKYQQYEEESQTIKVVIKAEGKAAEATKQEYLESLTKLEVGSFIAFKYSVIGSGKDKNRWYQKVFPIALKSLPQNTAFDFEKAIENDPAVEAAQVAALLKFASPATSKK